MNENNEIQNNIVDTTTDITVSLKKKDKIVINTIIEYKTPIIISVLLITFVVFVLRNKIPLVCYGCESPTGMSGLIFRCVNDTSSKSVLCKVDTRITKVKASFIKITEAVYYELTKEIPDTIRKTLKMIMNNISNVIEQVKDTLLLFYKNASSYLQTAYKTVKTNLIKTWYDFQNIIINPLYDWIIKYISTPITMIIAELVKFVYVLKTSVNDAIRKIIGFSQELGIDIMNGIDMIPKGVVIAINEMVEGLNIIASNTTRVTMNLVTNLTSDMSNTVNSIINTINTTLSSSVNDINSISKTLGDGLTSSISPFVTQLNNIIAVVNNIQNLEISLKTNDLIIPGIKTNRTKMFNATTLFPGFPVPTSTGGVVKLHCDSGWSGDGVTSCTQGAASCPGGFGTYPGYCARPQTYHGSIRRDGWWGDSCSRDPVFGIKTCIKKHMCDDGWRNDGTGCWKDAYSDCDSGGNIGDRRNPGMCVIDLNQCPNGGTWLPDFGRGYCTKPGNLSCDSGKAITNTAGSICYGGSSNNIGRLDIPDIYLPEMKIIDQQTIPGKQIIPSQKPFKGTPVQTITSPVITIPSISAKKISTVNFSESIPSAESATPDPIPKVAMNNFSLSKAFLSAFDKAYKSIQKSFNELLAPVNSLISILSSLIGMLVSSFKSFFTTILPKAYDATIVFFKEDIPITFRKLMDIIDKVIIIPSVHFFSTVAGTVTTFGRMVIRNVNGLFKEIIVRTNALFQVMTTGLYNASVFLIDSTLLMLWMTFANFIDYLFFFIPFNITVKVNIFLCIIFSSYITDTYHLVVNNIETVTLITLLLLGAGLAMNGGFSDEAKLEVEKESETQKPEDVLVV